MKMSLVGDTAVSFKNETSSQHGEPKRLKK